MFKDELSKLAQHWSGLHGPLFPQETHEVGVVILAATPTYKAEHRFKVCHNLSLTPADIPSIIRVS
jgi:hypothetical protein